MPFLPQSVLDELLSLQRAVTAGDWVRVVSLGGYGKPATTTAGASSGNGLLPPSEIAKARDPLSQPPADGVATQNGVPIADITLSRDVMAACNDYSFGNAAERARNWKKAQQMAAERYDEFEILNALKRGRT